MNSKHILDQINVLQGGYRPKGSSLTKYFSNIFCQFCEYDSVAKENTWYLERLKD